MVQHPKKKLESHRTHNHQGFLAIARQLSASIGIEFFQMIVKHLCGALDADCVYIAEFVGGPVARVRTVAACVESEKMEAFEFSGIRIRGWRAATPAFMRAGCGTCFRRIAA
jgi:hypothetical protein